MSDLKKEVLPLKMSELMNKEFPPLEWLVEGLIPIGDITIISGYPGCYKTWIMLDIAISSARGIDFLGKFKTKKEKILIIDEESYERGLQKRLRSLTDKKDLDIEILSFSGFNIQKTDQVIKYCLEKEIGVVMIDSLIRVHSLKDENSSIEAAKLFTEFKKFKQNGITLLIIHHNRKSGINKFSSAEDMRGSSEIFAAADCALSLKKIKKDEILFTQTKSRSSEEVSAFLVKKVDNELGLKFEFIRDINNEEERKTKPEAAQNAILDILLECDEVSRKELFSALGGFSNYSKKLAIRELVTSGTVKSRRDSDGGVFFSALKREELN